MAVIVQAAPIDVQGEVARRFGGSATFGAAVWCTGQVRGVAGDGAPVLALELDHYPGFTERMIEGFETQARARFSIEGVVIMHRVGRVKPGEVIVLAGAAAVHRRAAFEAVDYLMDRLKTDAPFWKKEHTHAGARWIEPRGEDHEDRRRWEEG